MFRKPMDFGGEQPKSTSESRSEYNYLFKLLIVGGKAAGKSSILSRFTNDKFLESHLSTIGNNFEVRTLDVDNKKIKLQIWDAHNLSDGNIRGFHGVLFVYDVTNMNTLEEIKILKDKIEKMAAHQEVCVMVLAGNKSDLPNREIPERRGREFAEQSQFTGFMEVSAKNNENIKSLFEATSRSLIKKMEEIKTKDKVIKQDPPTPKSPGGSCSVM